MQALKALVIGMGVLIVIGFIVLVIGLASKMSEDRDGFGIGEVAIPDGCSLAESQAEGDRLLLRLEGPTERDCAQILVIDLATGKEQGRIRLKVAD